VGVRCALSFCPPLQHFSATLSPPPPISHHPHLPPPPTAFARLKTLPAPSDRICSCMMNAQLPLPPPSGWSAWPWVPKPFCRPPLHESAEGSSKSRSLGSAITSISSSSSENSKSSVVGCPACLFRAEPDFTDRLLIDCSSDLRLSQSIIAHQIIWRIFVKLHNQNFLLFNNYPTPFPHMADEDLSDEQVRQLLKDAEERLRSKRAGSKTSLNLQNRYSRPQAT
jgi:hypothetical protein